MKIEVFRHYGERLKNKIVRTNQTVINLTIKVKESLINWLVTSNYYYSEITTQWRVFIYNSKDINRFKKPTNYDY